MSKFAHNVTLPTRTLWNCAVNCVSVASTSLSIHPTQKLAMLTAIVVAEKKQEITLIQMNGHPISFLKPFWYNSFCWICGPGRCKWRVGGGGGARHPRETGQVLHGGDRPRTRVPSLAGDHIQGWVKDWAVGCVNRTLRPEEAMIDNDSDSWIKNKESWLQILDHLWPFGRILKWKCHWKG